MNNKATKIWEKLWMLFILSIVLSIFAETGEMPYLSMTLLVVAYISFFAIGYLAWIKIGGIK